MAQRRNGTGAAGADGMAGPGRAVEAASIVQSGTPQYRPPRRLDVPRSRGSSVPMHRSALGPISFSEINSAYFCIQNLEDIALTSSRHEARQAVRSLVVATPVDAVAVVDLNSSTRLTLRLRTAWLSTERAHRIGEPSGGRWPGGNAQDVATGVEPDDVERVSSSPDSTHQKEGAPPVHASKVSSWWGCR